MNSLFFYPRLAAQNLRKNLKTYLPYMLSAICTIGMFYSMLFISNNPGLRDMPGASTLPAFFGLGSIIVGLFAFFLLFYTNSFLIKRRKKELGLYCILGMEKKHIAKVLFFEVLFTAVISIAGGIFGGILFSRLLYMLLLYLLGVPTAISFTLSPVSILSTLILFLVIFGFTLLSDLWQIRIANPIDLMRSSAKGEKEPKTRWVLAVFGVLFLGAGYLLAQSCSSPLDVMSLFFLAVICVIIGTYLLFIAGSILILKFLKKKKSFYYKPNNFTAVSGMIYRMKQNAAGLASICILSTMVLVTVSTTVSMFVGKDDMLRQQYPLDFQAYLEDSLTEEGLTLDQTEERFNQIAEKVLAENGVEAQNYTSYTTANYYVDIKEDRVSGEGVSFLEFMPLEDYNKLEGTDVSLKSNELLLFSATNQEYTYDTITIGGTEFDVTVIDHIGDSTKMDIDIGAGYYIIIVKDMNLLKQMPELIYQGTDVPEDSSTRYVGFDISDESKLEAVNDALFRAIEPENMRVVSLYDVRMNWYQLYSGFLFIGIFLGALFLMATVLIIYYKQISEGYDDRERFDIMQKVGLSKKEVRKTIHKQIIMIFFLPILVAVIHLVVAFHAIRILLFIFGLTNVGLFVLCTAVTILIFVAVYTAVYLLTARTYYRIVEH